MASNTTSTFVLQSSTHAVAANRVAIRRQRRITPQAGRALEILGHAIEYLADEFTYHGAQLENGAGQVEAMHLLMEINRRIYSECPEIPNLRERCSAIVSRFWN